ncbi:hypothetical protein HY988_07500 [Candidatus Micrarchaeota archaeon]|nr:hypothetical protein [Candidatus Micrarchaeota archaeon]
MSSIFAQTRYRVAFLLLLLFFLPILAITSDITVLPQFVLNPIADPLKILLMGIISLLIAINGSVIFHNYERAAASSKKTTVLGTVGALFTTTCPVCQPIWLVWLGFGSATAFLVELSNYLAVLSIGLLVISLNYSLKSASGRCEVK